MDSPSRHTRRCNRRQLDLSDLSHHRHEEDLFVRHGPHISRRTQSDWVKAAAELLRPLYELQRQRVLQSAVMWTDDTPVKVLSGGEEGSRQARFWAYGGDDQHPCSVYDFTMSRRRDGPQPFLQPYCGYLHADAYAGYDAIYLGSESQIIEVACWADACFVRTANRALHVPLLFPVAIPGDWRLLPGKKAFA